MTTPRTPACVCLLAALLVPLLAAAEPVEFNRDIRPILTKHCTACHGGVKAAGKVSFVSRDRAFVKGRSRAPVVVPGKPEASELYVRVTSKDPDAVMPRPDHGAPLSASEVATLRDWIRQGAQWNEHWSFVPPRAVAEPKLANAAWARLPLDRFVLARLQAEGLQPSAPAAPAEWLRRVSLDLTGLPPTAEEYAAYLQAVPGDARRAREAVVDRLLASPRFGERWASVWLDLARYADTYGYEKDPHREIWPWRDWVIRAFNADLPFDQFTVKQLAGDLLEKPTADDLLATGFHRNTQNNTEGGTSDEEFRTSAVLDRVNTTWTAWQAVTFGCVQCHAHPYDPFPQLDYYRFTAFFNNTEDCDQNDDFPRLRLPADPAKRDEAARLTLQLRQAREALNRNGRQMADKAAWKPLIPVTARTSGGTLSVGKDGRLRAGGTLPVGVTYTVTVPAVAGLTALRLQIFPDADDPTKWPERGSVLSHLQAALLPAGKPRQPVPLREVIADHLAGPFDPMDTLAAGGSGFGGFPVLEGPRWCVVVLDKPLPPDASGTLELTLKQGAASNSGFQGCPLRSFSLSASSDEGWSRLAADADRRKQWDEVHGLRTALNKLGGTQVPVLVERGAEARRDTRLFVRGNMLTKDESVQPGLPAFLAGPGDERRLSRLDLARWLVSDRNPLTARVLANRLWAELFGSGIVETLEDFGTSGARPSHPELLDHLALRLMQQHRWSIKAFLRELTLSATYGQTAKATPALVERDPKNRLLARGPRVRLSAEMVRDQALALSGLLSAKAFGPPVYPPQPEGVWRTVYSGDAWRTSQGEDRYRRAVYTYVKRTSGYPGFLTFDAPTRDACTARRVPTNTPLQALVTLNDPAFLEMAQALAKRVQGEGGPREAIARACRLLTLDEPPAAMVQALHRLYRDAVKEYRADLPAATRLAPTPEGAALVLVANTLLNLDRALAR